MKIILASLLACAVGAADAPKPAEVAALIDEAQAWLVSRAQPDGAMAEGGVFTAGITALAAGALIGEPRALPADHAAIAGATRLLAALKQPDGGVYQPQEGIGNYTTSVVLLYASALPSPQRDAFDIVGMQKYLFGLQNGDPTSLGRGGIGYGADKPAGSEDLSNTAYAVQALRASGVPASDPRLQAALGFLQRCQDLKSVNGAAWVQDSGGGAYGPQDAARSWESRATGGVPRFVPSGSMTYALLSTYLVLDIRAGDPRVDAAVGWVAANYGFDANPGMGRGRELQGLFHSHALAARALDLLGSPTVKLPDGRSVDWRADLYAALAARVQRVDLPGGGHGAMWLNREQRWGEGLPHLCTAYALRALKAIARTTP